MKLVRTARRARLLTFEGLESRAMLATATAIGNILHIVGNDASENVSVEQQTDGSLRVTGITNLAPGASSRVFPNIFGINARMGGGDDVLTLGSTARPLLMEVTAYVELGEGSDVANVCVNARAVLVNGGLQRHGAQDDVVNVQNSILAVLAVNTYAGDDQLNVTQSIIGTVSANLGVVDSGLADSDSFLFQSSAVGSAVLNAGRAHGDNHLVVHSTAFNSLNFEGGEGSDSLQIDSQGSGLGANLRAQIVTLVDSLEPGLASVRQSSRPAILFDRVNTMLIRAGFPLLEDIRTIFRGVSFTHIADASVAVDHMFDQTVRPISNSVAKLAALSENTTASSLTINTFGGTDTVSLVDVHARNAITVELGAADDTLIVRNVAASFALFNGGEGHFDQINNFVVDSPLLSRRTTVVISIEGFIASP